MGLRPNPSSRTRALLPRLFFSFSPTACQRLRAGGRAPAATMAGSAAGGTTRRDAL